jgi:hypothetical protein
MMQRVFSVLLFLVLAADIFAWDFGLLTQHSGEYSKTDELTYSGSLMPWYSWISVDKSAALYLSGIFTTEYKDIRKDDHWKMIPEAGRAELSLDLAGVSLSLGRIRFTDTAELVASGLFDGISASVILGETRLEAGAYYTGLLYAQSAEITMSGLDYIEYADEDQYLAPRRAFAALNWEVPAFLGERNSLSLGGLAQFDLRDKNDKDTLNSQYALVKFLLPPAPGLLAQFAGAAGFQQYEDVSTMNMAASALISYELPTKIQDKLSAGVKWGSGVINEDTGAFTPLTIHALGRVFDPNIQGMMAANLGYEARLHSSLSLSLEGSYFLRTDLKTFSDPEGELDPASRSHALGAEFYASLIWAPASDVSVIAGGGMFFPNMGGAFVSEAKHRWLVSAGLIISL